VTVDDNDEERHHHRDANDENLHNSHKETTQHIQLRECMLGDRSNILDRSASSAIRVAIHDGANVGIFG
jgi:hypothetical protein